MVDGWKKNSEDVIIEEKTQTEEDGWNICVSAEAADSGDSTDIPPAHHQVGGEIGEFSM